MYRRLTRFTVGIFSVVIAASFLGLTFKKSVEAPAVVRPQVKGESVQSGTAQEVSEPVAPAQFDILGEASWDCTTDIYDCESFASQDEAQLLFNFCTHTVGDIHNLDSDSDLVACD
ncbi:hypothetical protein A2630_00845 [Candidatus Woesebacteria bacterium RIFCSPHIGHO2_01_FULL_44_10]|uniref:Excalibur calcium-binding domain-containing protein n=1 Tax=Candidatus Woesebacteria bacterium RIFCSPLOWO2_01_FULL_44_14 TaxID=1802525 RepID=A0A1F8C1U7_9BACT|nr:MAG: hypothetical protein A2630_00845 [Candidatus Woesebacteria bacterium RIFCSPHIGHO2_01_FULL_44_10]OGM54331.1 MAG: hypothetical protein A3F62_01080 [Candidatus Woesebacteria bacterium RIFCSPHIGHO2_12_FULL_44_11]OGM70232.1 MAG: hypothetical protein A2975_04130 [Candidatus Woesebacteria bacterium RIFCSPLOWO2_01_FULL_44_14]